MKSNEEIIKSFLKELGLNDYRVEQEYIGLHKYKDIESELCQYILNGWNDDLLIVEGYDAKFLCENYSLSVLGAYNYLIYLHKKPKEAIENLKKGLPRY